MPTLTVFDEAVPPEGFHQLIRDALDADGYTSLALYIKPSNLTFHGSTTTLNVNVHHAVRSRAGDFVLLGTTHDFTDSTPTLTNVESYGRFLLVNATWDHEDGGDVELEVLVVPKR